MNTMALPADLRGLPTRHWVLAGLLSFGLFVTLAPDLSLAVPAPLMQSTTGALLAFLLAGAISLTPLLALVRPWWGLGLAGLACASVLWGGLLLACFAALMTVALLGPWRSRAAAVVAVVLGYAVMVGTVLGGVELVLPGGTRAVGARIVFGTGSHEVTMSYLLAWLGVVLVVLVAGLALRSVALRARAGQVAIARTAEVEEQSAVTAERARLARDLHDVVAHHVSLIAVRAETAPYTHPTIGEEARTVLREIAGDARLALDELRGVLGILNRSGGGADRSPQPGLGEIPALVERTRSAGVEVRLNGDVGVGVPPSVGYVAYRVVQEALTNARRHAPGSAVDLTLDASAGMLVVAVANPVQGDGPTGSGHGLAGMRERVEALGGHLEVGAQAGWFVVRATLPRRELR